MEKPEVEQGEFVEYMPHPGSPEKWPALITTAGTDSIDVLVFTQDGASVRAAPRSGVVHVSDPRLRDPGFIGTFINEGDGGVWDITPKARRQVAALEAMRNAIVQLAKGKKPNIDDLFSEVVDMEPAPQVAKPTNEEPKPLPKMSERFAASELTEEEKAAKRAALALAGG